MKIQKVTAEEVRPLRQRVLRPHQPVSELAYEGDDLATTVHFALFEAEQMKGIVSLYQEQSPSNSKAPADRCWRIRGMATIPESQGRGFGKALLNHAVRHARESGAAEIWCNARVKAMGFYGSRGFEIRGEIFEIPGIGQHFQMFLPVVSALDLLADD